MTILISEKIDFRTRNITRDKEGHFTVIKGSTHQEEVKIINVHAPNSALKYIEQKLTKLKKEINKFTII